jgi:8-oxo-dGTP pyrophosphatase MutT (NUDIX family)
MLHRCAAHGGFWQGVSGRVEGSDASLAAAAQREIEEETGIAGPLAILDLGRWIHFTSPHSGTRFLKRSLGAVLPAGTSASSVRLSEEHDEARVVTFDQARALVRFRENVEELRALEALVTLP